MCTGSGFGPVHMAFLSFHKSLCKHRGEGIMRKRLPQSLRDSSLREGAY